MPPKVILSVLCLALACGLAAPSHAAQPQAPATPADLTEARKAELDRAIALNRMGTLVIQTAPGAEVRVEQVRHEFWFGSAIASEPFGRRADTPDAQKYRETFLANFNCGVMENALKWHSMERQHGEVHYETVDAILKWADEHQIPLRGHNIYWGVPNMVQDWLKGMGDAELRETLKARGEDVGRRYRGRFTEYDLNNEMLHGNYYEKRLGPEITRQMTEWVREGDPSAVFFVNDYDILTGKRAKDYAAQIRKLREQGVPIGGIGVQGHSHGLPFDAEAMQNALDELARLKLPIRVTEFNMPGQNSQWYKHRGTPFTAQDEAAQAQALTDFYRLAFAHPAVAGILMWGFWEGSDWIPESALYRRDWTPRPAAQAYRDLVFKEWWTRWQGKADAQGRCEVRAFYGRHRVTVGGKDVTVELKRSEGSKSVTVK